MNIQIIVKFLPHKKFIINFRNLFFVVSFLLDYEEMILDFNSPDNTSVQCVNISIYDSGVSGSTEVVALSITTENSFVILDDTLSLITVENDGKKINVNLVACS